MQSTTTDPLVSVLIPTFNRPDLLRLAVKSVLDQTLEDLEVIVIDDASANDNRRLVEEFNDDRISYVRHDTNKGLPGARNTGVRLARGKFVAFLDDDDHWMPDKLEQQLRYIDGYEAAVCGFFVNTLDRPCVEHRLNKVDLRQLRKGNRFPPSGLMVRTEVIKRLEFDESLTFSEDWDALLRIAAQYRIRYVSKPLFVKTVDQHATMTSALKQMTMDDLESQLRAIEKSKGLLGSYWYRYRKAARFLSYIGVRTDRLERIAYTVGCCGLVPAAHVLMDRFTAKLGRIVGPS